jgi:hypothetical protein
MEGSSSNDTSVGLHPSMKSVLKKYIAGMGFGDTTVPMSASNISTCRTHGWHQQYMATKTNQFIALGMGGRGHSSRSSAGTQYALRPAFEDCRFFIGPGEQIVVATDQYQEDCILKITGWRKSSAVLLTQGQLIPPSITAAASTTTGTSSSTTAASAAMGTSLTPALNTSVGSSSTSAAALSSQSWDSSFDVRRSPILDQGWWRVFKEDKSVGDLIDLFEKGIGEVPAASSWTVSQKKGWPEHVYRDTRIAYVVAKTLLSSGESLLADVRFDKSTSLNQYGLITALRLRLPECVERIDQGRKNCSWEYRFQVLAQMSII